MHDSNHPLAPRQYNQLVPLELYLVVPHQVFPFLPISQPNVCYNEPSHLLVAGNQRSPAVFRHVVNELALIRIVLVELHIVHVAIGNAEDVTGYHFRLYVRDVVFRLISGLHY